VGLTVEVLDPFKEATLIYWGARQALDLDKRKVALFDVGGGSIKGLVGDAKECLFATSMPMACCACVTSATLPPDVPRRHPHRRDACASVGAAGDPPDAEGRLRLRHLHLGTALALARLAKGSAAGWRRSRASPGRAGATSRAVARRSEDARAAAGQASDEERAAIPGLSPLRADTLLPGTVVLRTLLELTDYPPPWCARARSRRPGGELFRPPGCGPGC